MKKRQKSALVVAVGGMLAAQSASAFFWKCFDGDDDYWDHPHYGGYAPDGRGGPHGWADGPYGYGWGGYPGYAYPAYGYPVTNQSKPSKPEPPPLPE